MLQRQRRRSTTLIARLAVLVTIALAACDSPTPTPSTPEVEPSGVVLPTAAAATLPEGARETAGMRLFGSDDWLVAYEVPGSDGGVGQYCIQFVSASTTNTTCEPVGDGDLTIVQGQSQRGHYIAVNDPQGRIHRVEVQAGGCRWANVGLEDGHLSWVEFLADRAERIAVLGADETILEGEALHPTSQARRHAPLPDEREPAAVIPHRAEFASASRTDAAARRAKRASRRDPRPGTPLPQRPHGPARAIGAA